MVGGDVGGSQGGGVVFVDARAIEYGLRVEIELVVVVGVFFEVERLSEIPLLFSIIFYLICIRRFQSILIVLFILLSLWSKINFIETFGWLLQSMFTLVLRFFIGGIDDLFAGLQWQLKLLLGVYKSTRACAFTHLAQLRIIIIFPLLHVHLQVWISFIYLFLDEQK